MSIYNYCVRITRSYAVCESLISVWAERCEKVAVYEHVGSSTNKTHIHMVLCGAEVCKKQLKNLLKIHNINTQGTLGGNKDWSFKDWDGDENACAYMTKGHIAFSYLKTWTDDDHQRWKSMWRGTPYHNADQDAYDDCFEESTFEPAYRAWKRDTSTDNSIYKEFRFIKNYVRDYVFAQHGRIWNLQAINKYKMLVYSYCFRNRVLIPDKHEVFKQY